MAHFEYEALTLAGTTSSGASGTGETGASTGTYNGYLHAVQYVHSTAATLSTGGHLTITGTRTGITLFSIENLGSTASNVYLPWKATVLSTDANTASTGAGRLPLFNETLTWVISSGSTGGAKAGTLRLFVE